ncbi:hypothetical protein ACFL34_00865, partial [Candidatus Sumerlaeota bacterium]
NYDLAFARDEAQIETFKHPVGSSFVCSPGKYTLQYELGLTDIERRDTDGKITVPRPGDWTGTLKTGALTLNVTADPGPAKADPKLEADLRIKLVWVDGEDRIITVDRGAGRAIEGERLALVASVENTGEVPFLFNKKASASQYEIEVDGVRYFRYASSFDTFFLAFLPGEKATDIQIPLHPVSNPWMNRGWGARVAQDPPPLLPPGKHTVRLVFKPDPVLPHGGIADKDRIRIKSNAIELDVAETNEGVEASIKSATMLAGYDEYPGWKHPALRVIVQAANKGDMPLGLRGNGLTWQLEVDGQWYEWVDPRSVGGGPLKGPSGRGSVVLNFMPGAAYAELGVIVAKHWRAIPKGREREYGLRRDGYYGAYPVSPDDYYPDQNDGRILKPGSHVIRLALICSPARFPRRPPVRALTNRIQLIVPSDEELQADRSANYQSAKSACSREYAEACDLLYQGKARPEVAAAFFKASAQAPGSRRGGIAMELAGSLLAMARQSPPSPKAPGGGEGLFVSTGDISLMDVVAGLIYRLRDVACKPVISPGQCRVLSGAVLSATPDSAQPAKRLRDLAQDPALKATIVPRLIKLLEDRRPTRSWTGEMNGGHVLRYCDIALEILTDVAGAKIPGSPRTTFDPRGGRGEYLGNADLATRKAIISRVKKWHATPALKKVLVRVRPEDMPALKRMMAPPTYSLQHILWGAEKPTTSAVQLLVDQIENTVFLYDTPANIKKLKQLLTVPPDREPAQLVYQSYRIKESQGPKLKALLEAVLRDQEKEPSAQRKITLDGSRLILRDTSQNLRRAEELLRDEVLIRDFEAGILEVGVFDLTPRDELAMDQAGRAQFAAKVKEVVKTILYTRGDVDAARRAGRKMWLNERTMQLTIMDYPENIARVSSYYVGSQPETKKPGGVWGKEVNGLVAAIELEPDKPSYAFGEMIDVRFRIKNVGKQTIQFSATSWRQDHAILHSAKDREVSHTDSWYSGEPQFKHYSLRPEQEVTLENYDLAFARDRAQEETFKPPIGSSFVCSPGQYTLQYELRLSDIERRDADGKITVPRPGDWTGTLKTGPLTLNVTAESALPGGAWGKAVEGAQARLRPAGLVVAEGETPRLLADIRNNGAKNWDVTPAQERCELEVDGVWYIWQGHPKDKIDVKSLSLSPGGRRDNIAITLDWHWHQRDWRGGLRPDERYSIYQHYLAPRQA